MQITKSLVCGIILAADVTLASSASPAQEARPPQWSNEVLDTFFGDAREKLEGERPDYGPSNSSLDVESALQPAGERAFDGPPFAWSKVVSRETLESEIKRLSLSLGKSVTTPNGFKGGGFKDARRDFGELAILFAVSAQYDGDARWKDTAADWCNAFAQAAGNARVGNNATFREALARKQDLSDLIRGGRPQVAKADVAVDDWSRLAARPPLMLRLNVAHQERLLKWLADENAFRRNQADVAHEAQIVALLANVIHRPEYEYWDDDTYAGYANDLQRAASDIATAAISDNYQPAREAIGRATNACADCHDGYRG